MYTLLHNQLLLDVNLEHHKQLLQDAELYRLLAEVKKSEPSFSHAFLALGGLFANIAERLKLGQPATG